MDIMVGKSQRSAAMCFTAISGLDWLALEFGLHDIVSYPAATTGGVVASGTGSIHIFLAQPNQTISKCN
jgi:hypothetical protein